MDEKKIADLRKRIDRIDTKIAKQLNERAKAVSAIGELKRRLSMPIYDEQREREIVTKLSINNEGPLANETLAAIYHDLLRHMKSFE